MGYRIGIDAGSKTIKLVVLDEAGETVHHLYWRHRSDIGRTLIRMCEDYVRRFGNVEGSIAVTGSAGIAVAEMLGLPFVQEVIATTRAVNERFPQADAIVELGGEDAKVVYLSEPLEQRMNATCAGGTGGFIDTMAFMLGVPTSEMNHLAARARRIYPIASRCAVFAQSDVRPLLNGGAAKEDIAASALEAVVAQTLGGLACGRPLRGTIVFLGGPFEFVPELGRRFAAALGLSEEEAVRPANAHLFTAYGAAAVGGDIAEEAIRAGREPANVHSLTQLRQKAAEAAGSLPDDDMERLPPLFADEQERRAFEERHASEKMPRANLIEQTGPLYLGFDAGSTTVKLAVVNEAGELVASGYRPARGDVLATARDLLEELYLALPANSEARIARSVAIGYGDELLRAAFRLDDTVVETSAHLRAALAFRPDASFVLDIGGQDMKALWVEDGRVSDAVLNEACSSGCGAFMEGSAHALGKGPEEFASMALLAKEPIELGTKCTVFMNSRVRHTQKVGANRTDIAAGIAYSVVRNALHRVIGRGKTAKLGACAVVQGGAFKSDAVLRAFELVAGVEAVRPDTAHLMGAIGAALIARDHAHELREHGTDPTGELIGPDELAAMEVRYGAWQCEGCGNGCTVSLVDLGGGRSFASGNRCPRGAELGRAAADRGEVAFEAGYGLVKGAAAGRARSHGAVRKPAAIDGRTATASVPGDAREPVIPYRPTGLPLSAESAKGTPPDVIAFEQKLLSGYEDVAGGKRGAVRVGIITALNGYESLPFWHELLSRLGFGVAVPTEERMRAVRSEAAESVPSESVCEPAKLCHPQAYALRAAGADAVLMPRFVRGVRCPVTCGYADVLNDSVPFLADGSESMVSPLLGSARARALGASPEDRQAIFEALDGLCGSMPLDRLEFDEALEAARAAQERFEAAVRERGSQALDWLAEEPERRGIVVAGRPYHMDPALLHGIGDVLRDLEFAVFPELALDLQGDRGGEQVVATELSSALWRPAKHLVRAAEYVCAHPQLDLVALQSFGCGYDAVSLEKVREVLAAAGRPFTALKIDEIVDSAHIRIRLRTMAEAIAQASKTDHDESDAETAERTVEARVTDPSLDLLACGIDGRDLETARNSVPPDICFTAAALMAHAVNAIDGDGAPERLRVPRVCRDCLLDALPFVLERATGATPAIEWVDEWPLPVAAAEGDALPADAADGGPGDRPRIGIVGNPLLCFDAYMNEGLLDLLAELGAEAVLPDPDLLFVDDVRYLPQLDRFAANGVDAVLYLQSFGCLKGHVQARGALREITARYPHMPLTVIDYDPESSALNRENRIRLALEAARRKRAN